MISTFILSAAAAIACLTASSNAFSPSVGRAVVKNSIHNNNQPLFAEAPDGPKDGTTITSARKEIGYDAASARFFETDLDAEDCIPDEEYCATDPKTGDAIRLTIEEKERMFLDALQSYYVSGRQVMPDNEFDSLKEDLSWNGSSLVKLNKKEIMYLEAMQSYTKGKPIMSDEEFDKLREDLKEEKSSIAVSKEPKCYIETGICTATFTKDNFRNNLLYLPALAILGLLWLGVGFEIIGGRINPIVLAALGTPVVGSAAKALTDNLIFSNNLVAVGACPSCETKNRIYFGNILGVEGFDNTGKIKCTNCKEEIIVQRRSLRASTLPKN